jgi:hypothetical protein
MKHFTYKGIHIIKTLIVIALFTVGVSFAAAFTQPSSAPTGGNVPAPVNTGTFPQTKVASFSTSNFASGRVASGQTVAAPRFCLFDPGQVLVALNWALDAQPEPTSFDCIDSSTGWPTGGSAVLPAGVNTNTLRHNGTDWIAAGNLSNNGSTVTVTDGGANFAPPIFRAVNSTTNRGLEVNRDGNVSLDRPFFYKPTGSAPTALRSVLTSNAGAGGLAEWTDITTLDLGLPTGTDNQTLRYDGSANEWEATSNLSNTGNRVFIQPPSDRDIIFQAGGDPYFNTGGNPTSQSVFISDEGAVGIGDLPSGLAGLTGGDTKLVVNGEVSIRGDVNGPQPEIGQVLTAISQTGLAEWQDISTAGSNIITANCATTNDCGETSIAVCPASHPVAIGGGGSCAQKISQETVASVPRFNSSGVPDGWTWQCKTTSNKASNLAFAICTK